MYFKTELPVEDKNCKINKERQEPNNNQSLQKHIFKKNIGNFLHSVTCLYSHLTLADLHVITKIIYFSFLTNYDATI